MAKAVIVSAARTAIGTLGGALAQQPATKLGAIAVREAVSGRSSHPSRSTRSSSATCCPPASA